MKTVVFVLLAVGSLVAQTSPAIAKTAKAASGKSQAKAQIPARPPNVPKEAVANADGSYSFTDPQGRNWKFVPTPFGFMKSEIGTTATTPESLAGVKAFDAGDKVRFEKTTPFGTTKWEKNKSDLTDDERTLVASQTAGSNAK